MNDLDQEYACGKMPNNKFCTQLILLLILF